MTHTHTRPNYPFFKIHFYNIVFARFLQRQWRVATIERKKNLTQTDFLSVGSAKAETHIVAMKEITYLGNEITDHNLGA